MDSELNMTTIGEHASVFSGYAFKSKDLCKSGIPVVKIKNVNNSKVDITSTEFFPINLVTSKHKKFLLKNGDILIAMTGQGSVGRVGRIALDDNKKVLLNQRVGKFEVKASMDSQYLYYILSSAYYEKILFDAAAGSGQPNLSPNIISSISIPFKPLPEQKRIAKILGDLDDKIELNRKMNETLEGMAQALFKSWFVDFDPVIDNALAAGNDIPEEFTARATLRQEIKTKGEHNPLPQNIRSLFPSSFTHTEELGWIPEGWEIKTLGDISTFKNGKKVDYDNSAKIPVWGANGVIGTSSNNNFEDVIVTGRVG